MHRAFTVILSLKIVIASEDPQQFYLSTSIEEIPSSEFSSVELQLSWIVGLEFCNPKISSFNKSSDLANLVNHQLGCSLLIRWNMPMVKIRMQKRSTLKKIQHI